MAYSKSARSSAIACFVATMAFAGSVLAETTDPTGAPAPAATSAAPATAPAELDTKPRPDAQPDAQDRKAFNAVYLELGGATFLYSVNYERLLNDMFSVRAGFSYWSVSASASSGETTSSASASILMIPVHANALLLGNNHKLEVGGGPVFVSASGAASVGGNSSSSEGFGVYASASLGYRYIPQDGGFLFRAAFTPAFNQDGFLPWGGLSFGAVL